jgi:hypothetical protein
MEGLLHVVFAARVGMGESRRDARSDGLSWRHGFF